MPQEAQTVDQEPSEARAAPEPPPTKARQSFAKLRRELTDEELGAPAVQKMLLDEIERLDRDVVTLSQYRDLYYTADKQCGVLEERRRKTTASEIVFGVCLAVGAAIIGYAPTMWQSQPTGWIAIVIGGVLIAGGIVARVVQQ